MDPEWYFDEKIPGVGTKPDWLEDKFANMAEQAKAYKEARKAIAQQEPVPDSYDLNEFKETVDVSNPHLQDFLSFAKESKLGQGQVSKVLKTLVDYEQSYLPDENKELEKLGPDGQKKRNILDQWAKNNLSKEAHEVYAGIPKTVEVMKFMEEIRDKQLRASSNSPQSMQHADSLRPPTEKEVRQEMANNYKRYTEDAVYRSEIQRKLAQALGEG